MKKTASQIANVVLTKHAEGLSEQDLANLEYINANVDRPFDKGTYGRLGGLGALVGSAAGAGGSATGSALSGAGFGRAGLRHMLRSGAIGGGALGLGGLGLAGLLHLLTERTREPMREQREEILSRA